jgi:hypothetical protein
VDMVSPVCFKYLFFRKGAFTSFHGFYVSFHFVCRISGSFALLLLPRFHLISVGGFLHVLRVANLPNMMAIIINAQMMLALLLIRWSGHLFFKLPLFVS